MMNVSSTFVEMTAQYIYNYDKNCKNNVFILDNNKDLYVYLVKIASFRKNGFTIFIH